MNKPVLFLLFLSLFLPFSTLQAKDLFEKGVKEYRAENFEEALEIFKEVEKTQPSTLLKFYLGLTYKQMGDFKSAKRCFSSAIMGEPKILDAYPEIIEVLYTLDELDEAKKYIEEAEILKLMPAKIAFLKGLLLLKQGKTKEAREAFEKAKALDKNLSQVADFQIALTYARERKIKEATKTLKALVELEPKTEIAEFSKDYLLSLERIADVYKKWSLNVSVGYIYDDNVVLKPSEYTGLPAIDGITGKADSAVLSNLRVEYRPYLSGKFFFSGDLAFYMRNYFDLNTYDTITGTLRLMPGYNTGKGSFALPIEAFYMLLNDKRYMSILSGRPMYTFEITGNHVGQVALGLAKREMFKYVKNLDPDEDRDSYLYSGLLGYYYAFSEGKGLFWSRYEYQIDDTDGRNWRSNLQRLSAGIIFPVSKKLSITLSGDATSQNFKKIHTLSGRGIGGFPSEPEKRKDRIYGMSVGTVYEVSKSFKLNLNYMRYRADSNFVIYDYKRNLITGELSLSF